MIPPRLVIKGYCTSVAVESMGTLYEQMIVTVNYIVLRMSFWAECNLGMCHVVG